MSTKEIDAWLSDNKSENPLIEDLKKHLDIYNGEYILTKLQSLTCVPDFFLNAVKFLMLSQEEQKQNDLDFQGGFHVLKFEIIGELIKNNDFNTKKKRNEKIQSEYDYLKSDNLFPESILIKFNEALKELQELSLSDIREIKRIVTENT